MLSCNHKNLNDGQFYYASIIYHFNSDFLGDAKNLSFFLYIDLPPSSK